MSDDPPECEADDCEARSAYLLPPDGDLCEDHAAERHPDTVRYLRATLGRPTAAVEAEEEDTHA